LKDLRDTITEAQDIEKMNGLYDASTLHKVDLDMRLRTIRNQIAGQRIGGTTSRSDIQDEVTDVFQVYAIEKQRFDRVSNMIDKLPGHTETLKAVRDQLGKKLENLNSDIQDTSTKNLVTKDPNVANEILEIIQLIKVLTFDIEFIPLQDAVAKSATNVKEAAQRRYDECSYTWWLLFILGWVLGFGGSIYGKRTDVNPGD
jgi:hypothetical protein